MRHQSEIEQDAAALADKPILTNFELAQVQRLVLEVLLDIRSHLAGEGGYPKIQPRQQQETF